MKWVTVEGRKLERTINNTLPACTNTAELIRMFAQPLTDHAQYLRDEFGVHYGGNPASAERLLQRRQVGYVYMRLAIFLR